jgi:hypothetical protein
MRKDREKAFELRHQDKSYKTISKELGIPLGTLAGWFRHELWSHEIRDRLGREASLAFPEKLRRITAANKKRWADLYESYRQEAMVSFPELKDDPLFLAGLMLYWGEGDKSQKNVQVKLTNSDPEMIRIFHRFFIETLRIPKEQISAWLLLYPDLIDTVQKNFWSRSTGIPIKQFKKSIYIRGRHPTKRLSYGVCSIFISSRALKERMLKWLELYQNHFRSQSFDPLEK